MNNRKKLVVTLLISCFWCVITSFSILAANSTVTYVGGADKFIFLPGSKYEKTDLFDGFKNVMPGDTLKEIITVKNEYSGCDYVKIFIRAEEREDIDEVTDFADGEAGDGSVTMREFLSKLHMEVKQGDKVLFSASPDELDGLKENVLLGSFGYGSSTALDLELYVPIELGNEYANCVGGVNWIFTVEHRNEPADEYYETKPNSPNKDSFADQESIEVPVDEGTLGVLGEYEEVEEGFLAVLPMTGDNTMILPYVLIALISIFGIAILLRKRGSENEDN